ncbi:MAG: 3-hydroxyacyl-CoA dehydrogenase NAD-binding domain-containing protein [Pseudomonadota bacterium]
MRPVKTLGLLGTGVIGGGWAARALHCGIDVIAADVNPSMEDWIRGAVENAAPALDALTEGMAVPRRGALTFTTDAEAMAEKADFIQENVPERLDIKQSVLATVSRIAGPDVVIASSTSGIQPSDMQDAVVYPERFLVGHPFNPVYLLPLVELVGGNGTAPGTIAAAREFYLDLGMHPLAVNREIPGHISDRLQEAMWREILHMVAEGEATTDELDQSIVYGPGMRWAIMGTNMVFHIAGGESGMRHMLEQFGPALEWPWTRLKAPELTDDLIDRMVEGTQRQAAGRSIRDLERIRDECLVAMQRVLAKHDMASGATLNAFEARLAARTEPS